MPGAAKTSEATRPEKTSQNPIATLVARADILGSLAQTA
jgi:hypothetical protein